VTHLPYAKLQSLGVGHHSGPLLGHPGRLDVYVMCNTADEATLGLWHQADEPYHHRMLMGSGLLRRDGDMWRGQVHEGKGVWHVSGTLAHLAFAETPT